MTILLSSHPSSVPAAARRLGALAGALALLGVATPARAALLVYEPFDYEAGTVLDALPATGFNLTGDWVPLGPVFAQKLEAFAPGLDYGNLVGAPPALGNRANDVAGVTAGGGTVEVADDVLAPPGTTLFWSALFVFDDRTNGNRLANITLIDDTTGDELSFGQPSVGSGAIRVSAETAASGIAAAAGADDAFVDGQTLLLIGRYVNATAPGADRLDLVGYDTADADVLPASFDPTDPQAEFAFAVEGFNIDFTRVSSIRFAIRGDDNNFIDELRIGTSYGDVVVPEPGTGAALGLGLLGLRAARRPARA